MIIGAAEIITSALVFGLAKANDFIKNQEAHRAENIQLEQEYCLPVTKLPLDFPPDRMKIYQEQCQPMLNQLQGQQK